MFSTQPGERKILSGIVQVGSGNKEISSQAEMDLIVSQGVTLTIEPGTDVRGAADGVLLVTRGSKLEAIGTAAQPITFSSLADEDYTPETAGVIANVTIIGGDAANSAGEFGMRLRGSVTAAIHNSAVTGYDVTCARIDDSDHDNDSATAKIDTPITMRNFLCDTAGAAFFILINTE